MLAGTRTLKMYHTENTNRKEKMTIEKAIAQMYNAVEYYDMQHDTGDSSETEENIDKAWEGYETIAEFINKHKK